MSLLTIFVYSCKSNVKPNFTLKDTLNNYENVFKIFNSNKDTIESLVKIFNDQEFCFSIKRFEPKLYIYSSDYPITYDIVATDIDHIITFEVEESDLNFIFNNFDVIRGKQGKLLKDYLLKTNIPFDFFEKCVTFLSKNKIYMISKIIDDPYIEIRTDPFHGIIYTPEKTKPHLAVKRMQKINESFYYFEGD